MLQMTLHLTRSSRLWIFQLLGFEVFQVRLQKKTTSTVSLEIHTGVIFHRLKIKNIKSIHDIISTHFYFSLCFVVTKKRKLRKTKNYFNGKLIEIFGVVGYDSKLFSNNSTHFHCLKKIVNNKNSVVLSFLFFLSCEMSKIIFTKVIMDNSRFISSYEESKSTFYRFLSDIELSVETLAVWSI
jgi:hypothetical protein